MDKMAVSSESIYFTKVVLLLQVGALNTFIIRNYLTMLNNNKSKIIDSKNYESFMKNKDNYKTSH